MSPLLLSISVMTLTNVYKGHSNSTGVTLKSRGKSSRRWRASKRLVAQSSSDETDVTSERILNEAMITLRGDFRFHGLIFSLIHKHLNGI